MICPACHAENLEGLDNCFSCGQALGGTGTLREIKRGTVIAGRYEIQLALGKGGMGVVYKAYDQVLEETVALKVLRTEIASQPEIGRRFRHEIKLARRVTHRNVCRIHEYGVERDMNFISMEFVDGENLRQILRHGGGHMSTAEALGLSVQVCDGLHAIHEVGIIHRDLKTANIMRDRSGVVKLMDFGIAKLTGTGTEGLTAATSTGQIIGTPEYMSPEQARGEKLDVRSDIYSLGIVLYELFTGSVPFRGDTPIATILKHINDPVVFDAATLGTIPRPVLDIVNRSLAKNREERYSTADELGRALRQAGASMSGGVPPVALTQGTAALAPEPAPGPLPETTPLPTPPSVTDRVTPTPSGLRAGTRAEQIQEALRRAEQAGARARRALAEGAVEEAERCLNEADQAWPGLQQIAELRATLVEVKAETTRRAASRIAALESLNRGRALLGEGRVEEAQQAIEAASKTDPAMTGLAEARSQVAEALSRRERWRSALERGVAGLDEGKDPAAVAQALRRVLASEPDDRLTRDLRAKAEELLASAERQLAEAKELEETLAKAREALRARDLTAAEAALAAALARAPSSESVRRIQGEVSGLKETARRAEELASRAAAALAQGKLDEARRKLDEAERAWPNLAQVAELRRRLAEADALAKRRRELQTRAAESEKARRRGSGVDALRLAAEALALDGSASQAQEAWRKASDLVRDSVRQFLAKGRWADAQALLTSALGHCPPGQAETRAQLAELAKEAQRGEAASRAAEAEKVVPPRAVAPAPAVPSPAPVTRRAPSGLKVLAWLGGGVSVLLAGTFLVARLLQPPVPTPAPSPTEIAPSTEPTGGAGAVATGSVILDAFPWAEIVSVIETKSGPVSVTERSAPAVLALPGGHYVLSLRYRGETKTAEVSVEPGAASRLRVEFQHVDAEEYLRRAGVAPVP